MRLNSITPPQHITFVLGFGNEHFWTAGTDQGEEGSFFWMSTGRPVTFTNWNAGEPVRKKRVWQLPYRQATESEYRHRNCFVFKAMHFPNNKQQLNFPIVLLFKRNFFKFICRTISDTKMAKRNIVWNCGTAMGKDWNGTIVRVRLKPISFAKHHFKIRIRMTRKWVRVFYLLMEQIVDLCSFICQLTKLNSERDSYTLAAWMDFNHRPASFVHHLINNCVDWTDRKLPPFISFFFWVSIFF